MELKILKNNECILITEYSQKAEISNYIFFIVPRIKELLDTNTLKILQNVVLDFDKKQIKASIETIKYTTDFGQLAFKI